MQGENYLVSVELKIAVGTSSVVEGEVTARALAVSEPIQN